MHYVDNQSKAVLIGERIFNETELNSRLEVELEKYTMKVQIEGRVLGDLAINHIVPTAVAYQNRLLENLRGLKEIFPADEYEVLSADRKELIREISHRVTSIKVLVREMTEARKVANHLENYKERAFAYEEKVRPYLDQIRRPHRSSGDGSGRRNMAVTQIQGTVIYQIKCLQDCTKAPTFVQSFYRFVHFLIFSFYFCAV